MKKAAVATALLTLLVPWLFAKKFWEESYLEWSRKNVLKMLNDSPWAEQYVRTRNLGGKGSGIGGQKELYDTFTVRFFSSLPVRHAYFRMLQILNDYENMSEEQQSVFDQKFSRILQMDFSDQIIVALEFSSNDQELARSVDLYLRTKTRELVKQDAFLISDRLGRIEIEAYYPPSKDGTGAKFVFPRMVEGQPAVSEKDKQVKFEFNVPNYGRVLVRKNVKDLTYNGKLEI